MLSMGWSLASQMAAQVQTDKMHIRKSRVHPGLEVPCPTGANMQQSKQLGFPGVP